MNKDKKNSEKKRNLRLVEKFDNDDYSRFAGPDYLENSDFRSDYPNVIGHHAWDSGITGGDTSEDGEYFGYGPVGYNRSDDKIYEDACEILMRHRGIDATDIAVNVKEGVIYLSGAVTDFRTKISSEKILLHITGVKDIVNELSVIPLVAKKNGPEGVTRKDLGIRD